VTAAEFAAALGVLADAVHRAATTGRDDLALAPPPADTEENPEMADTNDFQDRGEAARQAVGIDGTAGDAQDTPHQFRADDETGGCLLCGMARTYRKHMGAQR
jgi:hypothetical protein